MERPFVVGVKSGVFKGGNGSVGKRSRTGSDRLEGLPHPAYTPELLEKEAMMSLKHLFTEHPDAVGESYFEHMGVALSFAGPLALAALAALVHAFLPFLCVTTASRTVKRLYGRMTNRVPAPNHDTLGGWDPVI
jgi:hypothetical protein